jgi:pimeloyl-ACP methyl ester carboxylesterase
MLTRYRFFGPLVEEQMKTAATNVVISEVFEDCGHSLSLEQPERLANLLKKFLL